MDTAIINIRTNAKVKAQAQKVARSLGFSLSAIINGYLRTFIKTKTVHHSTSEEPSEYLIKALKESEADRKAGRVISFASGEEAIKYLDRLIAQDAPKRKKD